MSSNSNFFGGPTVPGIGSLSLEFENLPNIVDHQIKNAFTKSACLCRIVTLDEILEFGAKQIDQGNVVGLYIETKVYSQTKTT